MFETWQQTKQRLAKQGIKVVLSEPMPQPRYDEPKEEIQEPRFNLRRTLLPGIKVDWLVSNATRAEIDWWMEHKHRFKKSVQAIDGIPTVELIEVLSVNATVKERSPYYNTRPVIITDSI